MTNLPLTPTGVGQQFQQAQMPNLQGLQFAPVHPGNLQSLAAAGTNPWPYQSSGYPAYGLPAPRIDFMKLNFG
jgi:hypothetical protein